MLTSREYVYERLYPCAVGGFSPIDSSGYPLLTWHFRPVFAPVSPRSATPVIPHPPFGASSWVLLLETVRFRTERPEIRVKNQCNSYSRFPGVIASHPCSKYQSLYHSRRPVRRPSGGGEAYCPGDLLYWGGYATVSRRYRNGGRLAWTFGWLSARVDRGLHSRNPGLGSQERWYGVRCTPKPSAGSLVTTSRIRRAPKPSAGSTPADHAALLASLRCLRVRGSSTRPRPSSPPGEGRTRLARHGVAPVTRGPFAALGACRPSLAHGSLVSRLPSVAVRLFETLPAVASRYRSPFASRCSLVSRLTAFAARRSATLTSFASRQGSHLALARH